MTSCGLQGRVVGPRLRHYLLPNWMSVMRLALLLLPVLFLPLFATAAERPSGEEDAAVIGAGFMDSHPDMMYRQWGVNALRRNDVNGAMDNFRLAARYADKPAQGYLGGFRLRTDDGILGYLVVLDAFPGPAQAEAVRAATALAEDARPGQRRISLPAVPDATCYTGDHGVPGTPLVNQRCLAVRAGYLATVEVYGSDRVDDTTALASLARDQVDLIDGP